MSTQWISTTVYNCIWRGKMKWSKTAQTNKNIVLGSKDLYSHMPLGAPGWRGGIMGGMPPGGGPPEGGPDIIRPGIGWPGPIGPAGHDG